MTAASRSKSHLDIVEDGPAETPAQTPGDIFAFTRLGHVRELEEHGQFTKWVGDHDILVFRKDGQIKALSNICPHFGGPVGYHQMKDGVFVCLWHNYKYTANDGRCLTVKKLCLREYKLKIEDGVIWVQLVEKA